MDTVLRALYDLVGATPPALGRVYLGIGDSIVLQLSLREGDLVLTGDGVPLASQSLHSLVRDVPAGDYFTAACELCRWVTRALVTHPSIAARRRHQYDLGDYRTVLTLVDGVWHCQLSRWCADPEVQRFQSFDRFTA